MNQKQIVCLIICVILLQQGCKGYGHKVNVIEYLPKAHEIHIFESQGIKIIQCYEKIDISHRYFELIIYSYETISNQLSHLNRYKLLIDRYDNIIYYMEKGKKNVALSGKGRWLSESTYTRMIDNKRILKEKTKVLHYIKGYTHVKINSNIAKCIIISSDTKIKELMLNIIYCKHIGYYGMRDINGPKLCG